MNVKVFSAAWCSQCSPFKEQLDRLGITFESVDVDEHVDLAYSFGIRGLPTTIVFKDGQEVFRVSGPKVNEVKTFLGVN